MAKGGLATGCHPSVTDFERRQIRNHIKDSDEHLRYYLGMVSDRLRLQSRIPA